MTDREKLIEVLGEFLLWPSKMKNVWMPQGIEKLADHLIANGVVVREKGEWETERYDDFDGNIAYEHHHRECGCYVRTHQEAGNDFCPNCGADMRKGENG